MTNRAGFFKAIAGGVAALAGFEPVERFRICKAVFVKPKSMGRIIRYSTAPIRDADYVELLGESPEDYARKRIQDSQDLIDFYKGKQKNENTSD